MSYQVYKVVHLIGAFALFLAIGGLFLHAINGGTRDSNASRKLVAISHGVALFIVLLGGFGMLARLGITGAFPGYIWFKLVIWLVMGAIIAIPYRVPSLARPLWLLLPFIGGLAAWAAIYKPFT